MSTRDVIFIITNHYKIHYTACHTLTNHYSRAWHNPIDTWFLMEGCYTKRKHAMRGTADAVHNKTWLILSLYILKEECDTSCQFWCDNKTTITGSRCCGFDLGRKMVPPRLLVVCVFGRWTKWHDAQHYNPFSARPRWSSLNSLCFAPVFGYKYWAFWLDWFFFFLLLLFILFIFKYQIFI